MADKVKESGWFKVATSGPTVDGREIKESWVKDMAETYDQNEYTACIFEDHISWFGNYGQVTNVKAEKDDKGRLCLFTKVIPNRLLIELNKTGQKLFTSIQVAENFANTGKAYLTHLAITDTPASLGTDQLSFSHNGKTSQVFTNDDGIDLDFETSQTDEELAAEIKKRPNFIKRFFSNSPKQDDEPMTDAEKAAFEKLQTQVAEFKTELEKLTATDKPAGGDEPREYTAEVKALKEKIDQLEAEKVDFTKQSETLNTLNENFTKLQSDFADAMKDKTDVPNKSKGEAEASFEIF